MGIRRRWCGRWPKEGSQEWLFRAARLRSGLGGKGKSLRAFADLYLELDETTKTVEKVAALKEYFRTAPAADAAWAVYFLSGRRIKGLVKTARLRSHSGSQNDPLPGSFWPEASQNRLSPAKKKRILPYLKGCSAS